MYYGGWNALNTHRNWEFKAAGSDSLDMFQVCALELTSLKTGVLQWSFITLMNSSILWADQETKTLIFSLVEGSGDFCEVSYSVLRNFFPEVKDTKYILWMDLCVISTSIILWCSVTEHTVTTNTVHWALFCNQISSLRWAASGDIPLRGIFNARCEIQLPAWGVACVHLTSFVVIT